MKYGPAWAAAAPQRFVPRARGKGSTSPAAAARAVEGNAAVRPLRTYSPNRARAASQDCPGVQAAIPSAVRAERQDQAPRPRAAHSSKGVRLFLIMRSTPFQDSF